MLYANHQITKSMGGVKKDTFLRGHQARYRDYTNAILNLRIIAMEIDLGSRDTEHDPLQRFAAIGGSAKIWPRYASSEGFSLDVVSLQSAPSVVSDTRKKRAVGSDYSQRFCGEDSLGEAKHCV